MFAPPLDIFRAVGFRIGGFKKVAEAPGDDVVSAPDTALFRASPAKSSGNGFSKIRFFSDEKSHALYPHALRRGSLLFQ